MKTVLYLLTLILLSGITGISYAGVSLDNDSFMALSYGKDLDKTDIELCPQGARTISVFLAAWQREDYESMYRLIDEKSKKDYTLEHARFDFQFLEFKEYTISTIRKKEDDFEFTLSYGDWKDGDKDIIKMMISGRSFKIIMPEKNSPFKRSVTSYF